ncbi:tyrosine-type recombinase/integrase [Endozoicomonas arenosclerae]|uniref:tyrosine-type recombinase/integrase n=1 Tax=Endozoicomonas arenosclerae TaxID=1633495 RepID=UPI000785CDAD|nr:tyrosine-type recombinase/integrase [Endozoicomonas arenosclerae]
MAKLTPLQLKNIKYRLTEQVGSRGDGVLLFEKRNSGTVEAYYKYKQQGKESKVKLGQYKLTRDGHGFSLAECRDKAQQLANTRRECGGDLKAHLEAQELEHQKKQQELKRQEELAESQGTLSELCENYVSSLYRQGKKSARVVEGAFALYVQNPFPNLAKSKAKDITVEDIVTIIRRMIEKGITTTSNRLRSYLHAAYEYGMKADNDPREQVEHGKRFFIEHNPVSAVPRQADFERVRERYLNHQEIKRLWNDFIPSMPNRSPVFGLLLRFMLATAGNRPEQITLCRWSDIDFERRHFTFIERKGKSGNPRKRVMPLTARALQILEELKLITGSHEWPFSITGKAPLKVTSLTRRVNEYCSFLEAEAKAKGEQAPERFTSKDMRRTATNLLIECRVPQEQRFLIQSREDGSIESKHYDHSDRLPEKREALKRYGAFLDKILKGEATKLVDLDQYRQTTSRQD